MYAKTLQYLPNEWPLNLVICSFEVYKTEVQWFMCMFLLVNDMLQNKCLMNSDRYPACVCVRSCCCSVYCGVAAPAEGRCPFFFRCNESLHYGYLLVSCDSWPAQIWPDTADIVHRLSTAARPSFYALRVKGRPNFKRTVFLRPLSKTCNCRAR